MYRFKYPLGNDALYAKVPHKHYGPIKDSPHYNSIHKDSSEGHAVSSFDVGNASWKVFDIDLSVTTDCELYLELKKNFSVKAILIEILKDRLYFYSSEKDVLPRKDVYIFNTDEKIVYMSYHLDFGPFDIGATSIFINYLKKILHDKSLANTRIVLESSFWPGMITNHVVLLGIFLIEVLHFNPPEAYRPFKHINFLSFRDASYGPSTHEMTVLDVLNGFYFGKQCSWYSLKTFDIDRYIRYESVEQGDMNVIVPNKILAFAGPVDIELSWQADYPISTPETVLPILKEHGVSTVIRLNEKQYNERVFIKGGLDFHELYFPDGSCPPGHIIHKFIDIVDKATGVVAVHCKAGLGRTGTLITCYCMLRYRAEARKFIGWIRLMRPGSVLGPQQAFVIHLEEYFHKLHDGGEDEENNRQIDSPLKSVEVKAFSFIDKLKNKKQADIAINGDQGQALRLLSKKNKS